MHQGSHYGVRVRRRTRVLTVDDRKPDVGSNHILQIWSQEKETLGIAPIFWKDETAGREDYRALLPMTRN